MFFCCCFTQFYKWHWLNVIEGGGRDVCVSFPGQGGMDAIDPDGGKQPEESAAGRGAHGDQIWLPERQQWHRGDGDRRVQISHKSGSYLNV